jgi:predicted kinase
MLIALAGLPGAGKSTLAKGLQTRLHAEVVSRDTIRMAEFPDWGDRAAKRAAFEIVRLDVGILLRAGATVIVDGATLATRAERRELHELAATLDVPFVLLWLDAPADIAAARIASDAHEAPMDRTPDIAHAVSVRFEVPTDDEEAVRMEASEPPAAVLDAAVAAIAARR